MTEPRLCLRRELQRQPCLSHTANPRQRDDPRRFDRFADAAQLGLAPDELGHLSR